MRNNLHKQFRPLLLLTALVLFVFFKPCLLISADQSQEPAQGKRPRRRALLVHISNYSRQKKSDQTLAGITNKMGLSKSLEFENLNGPANDARELKELLHSRYGFTEIYELSDEQATREGILNAMQRYLIDDAEEGDECLFYFSGHGSYVKNSKSGQRNDRNETLVPVDYVRPVNRKEDLRDIRDQELRRYFNRALDKGVVLTAIVDSCHSGGIVRGEREISIKAGLGIDNFDLKEPPEADLPSLAKRGALFFAAAGANENALVGELKKGHSDFTFALLQVLSRPRAELLSAEMVKHQVTAYLRRRNLFQSPVMEAGVDRMKKDLFGSPAANGIQRPVLTVMDVDQTKKVIKLDHGRAFGVTEGCELSGINPGNEKSAGVRLKVVQAEMAFCLAQPLAATDLNRVKVGDLFEQQTWTATKESVKVWFPATLEVAAIKAAAGELGALRRHPRIKLVEDPTKESATHLLYFDGRHWRLELPAGVVEVFNQAPSAAQVAKICLAQNEKEIRLFISLPLAAELRNRIKLGALTDQSAVVVVAEESEAVYQLVGRLNVRAGKIEYAWALRRAIPEDRKLNRADQRQRSDENGNLQCWMRASQSSPLPRITDWIDLADGPDVLARAAAQLEEKALKLNHIYGWMMLAASEEQDESFPARLSIKKANERGEICPDEDLIEGKTYELWLTPDVSTADTEATRYVYLISIAQNGESYLLYPDKESASQRLPLKPQRLTETDICGPRTESESCRKSGPGVLGAETFILLTTLHPLSDPTILEFSGVKQAESRGFGLESVWEKLSKQSSPGKPKKTWSVHSLFMHSVPSRQN